MKKYKLLGLFLLGFLLLGTNIGLVAATDDDSDGVDDDIEELNKRDITIEFDSNEFQVESKLRNGDKIDEIQLKVKYDSNGLEVDVSYEEEIETGNSTEYELEFDAVFRKIIEYVDLNGNGLYDDSTDQLIQEVELDSFQPVIYTSESISTDTTLHYVTVNTTDGVFTAHIFFVEEFDLVNETFIAPTETKIDIEITDFNFIDDNSQLALYIKLGSEVEYEEDHETEDEEQGHSSDEDGTITEVAGNFGFFTWKENATVDDVVMNVLANPLEADDDDPTEQKLILNYPRGNHIYHDPKIGVGFVSLSSDNLPLIITGIVISIIVVAVVATVIVVKKRK
jgi:hypothetical protein